MPNFDRPADNISLPERESLYSRVRKAVNFIAEIDNLKQVLVKPITPDHLSENKYELLNRLEQNLLECCDQSFTTAQTEDSDGVTAETLASPFYNSQYFLFNRPAGGSLSLRLKKNLIESDGLSEVIQPFATLCLFRQHERNHLPQAGLYPADEFSLEPRINYTVYEYFTPDIESGIEEYTNLGFSPVVNKDDKIEIIQDFRTLFTAKDIHKGGKVNKIIKA
jgi:hypothetical protein